MRWNNVNRSLAYFQMDRFFDLLFCDKRFWQIYLFVEVPSFMYVFQKYVPMCCYRRCKPMFTSEGICENKWDINLFLFFFSNLDIIISPQTYSVIEIIENILGQRKAGYKGLSQILFVAKRNQTGASFGSLRVKGQVRILLQCALRLETVVRILCSRTIVDG